MLELTSTHGNRRIYETGNERGRLVVEIATVEHDRKSKSGLMSLWVKNGWMSEFLDTTLNVSTYFYPADGGGCFGRYNPTEKAHESGRRSVVDFAWKLEATPENEARILAECERMMLADERK